MASRGRFQSQVTVTINLQAVIRMSSTEELGVGVRMYSLLGDLHVFP